jgi:hypothetical protein
MEKTVSYESRFYVKSGLPRFQHLVGKSLGSGFDGIDCKIVDHVKNVGRNALGDLQHPPQRFWGQHGWIMQRRVS